MSDSLRDQLIAAGFEAPKKPDKKARTHKKSHKNTNSKNAKSKKKAAAAKQAPGKNNPGKNNKESVAAIAERKKLKAQIKELIDNNKLENWKGEVAFRYTVEKRIRELYVNEAVHKQLAGNEIAITRLNGDTYLVPQAIATEVVKINPQWSVFNTGENTGHDTPDDEYSDFQVPDDLKW